MRSLFALLLVVGCGGGGGDDGGGTGVQTVASVAITAPAGPQAFQTLTRTAQFSAVARDASSATVAGATISWLSSNPAAATVSGTGLVTAVANGSTQITASASGVTSTAVTVTVAQVVANVTPTPASVAFGAIGSTRQLAAALVDSSGAPVAGAPAVTWTREGTGTTASVSAGGLATAIAAGATDTAVATAGGRTARIPISVTQVIASISVSPTPADTLRTTTRSKQYSAAAADSLGNPIAGASLTWSSSAPAVATVGAGTGLATAVADGSADIIASAGSVTGQRTLVVRRYASTFGLTPPSGTITTALGTVIFLGTAQDSINTNLPITWATRSGAIAGVSATTGAQVTATGAGNGTTFIVMSAGTRSDSAQLTVSGQSVAPLTATVLVGNFFFRSQRNSTQNEAIDTVAVGGSVTWEGTGGSHTVQSQGAPSFPSSGTFGLSGTYTFTFGSTGTYLYDCAIHGSSMSGRIVVR
ncbi:MAG: Ig-like domain-containing protein [Gemmatimonadetes bacterium]|nr:Ig-like domain-containing protein [Gemmatimonadota bacterium]